MADVRVTCITRDGADADRRIDRLGGPQPSGDGRWNASIDEVIDYIRKGTHHFWITAGGKTVWLVVRVHPTSGRYYLTTEADAFPPNNLLSLPDCP
jgi:hypothetical protein